MFHVARSARLGHLSIEARKNTPRVRAAFEAEKVSIEQFSGDDIVLLTIKTN
jgi:hypothetical protein